MDDSDPYRGTNPWSLARYLRNSCSRCPVCRKECGFEVSFDKEEEVIRMSSDCPDCGKTTLVPYVTEEGDIAIETVEGSAYEPDQGCFEILSGGPADPSGASPERLEELSRLAKGWADTRRRHASAELGKSIATEYRSNLGKEGWEDAKDRCLAQCSSTANVLIESNLTKDALELFNEFLPLTEDNPSGAAFAFILNRSFALFSEGDTKESTSSVREVITALDRMKSENRLPADDPFIRSRAYEALGVLLSAKNDKTGSMKAMKKAFEDSLGVLSSKVTEEGLTWMNRCSREYAFACFQADMKKRSMEALKDAVKFCVQYRDRYPHAYAEALLERAMFISDSGAELPPYMRSDMDTAIEMLSKPGSDGHRGALLPVAYFYRSMTGSDKEKLDSADLETAYGLLRDGTEQGKLPDGVFTSVVDTYITYLDANDSDRASAVRRELAEMGIMVRPPPMKKN